MGIIVGITMSFDGTTHALRHDYIRAVELAGAVPLPIAATESDHALGGLIGRLDGLIISGGPAITDGLVGSLPDDIAPTDPLRSRFDKRIAAEFMSSQKPVLGICYGMQLLNALDGGEIYADVERQVEGALAHSPKRGGTTHPIDIVASTHLSRVLGTHVSSVNTRHIQAIARLGSSFRVAATSPDGVIEAIETTDGRVSGVQFHPERMNLREIFEELVSRCR